jgi:hypothetical protein
MTNPADDYPPYEHPPAAGSEWPPPPWSPPFYDHELDFTQWLYRGADVPPEPDPPVEPEQRKRS